MTNPFEQANAYQPAPCEATADVTYSWDAIAKDLSEHWKSDENQDMVAAINAAITERDARGIAKYGVRHHWLNGRDHAIDAMQELMDAMVYQKALCLQVWNTRPLAPQPEMLAASSVYWTTLNAFVTLARYLWMRAQRTSGQAAA